MTTRGPADLHIDDVVVDNGDEGLVVASIDLGEYSDQYPEAEWAYLKTGVLVVFHQIGLVHFSEIPPNLRRKPSGRSEG